MVWLVSYPRSGNTYVRNILYHVFGKESSVYHKLPDRKVPEDFADYPFVKTHLLPNDLPDNYRDRPVVYILRDGRDAIVSEAWHRKDFHAPRSKVRYNMLEATLAAGGSHFGGWSHHVRTWLPQADVIIRFHDLLIDPLSEVEKIRAIADLPRAETDQLPTFLSQKMGTPKYGRVSREGRNRKFFRKGKAGSWKEEMPRWMQDIFWRYHGDVMEVVGFHRDDEPEEFPDWTTVAKQLATLPPNHPERTRWENILLLLTRLGIY